MSVVGNSDCLNNWNTDWVFIKMRPLSCYCRYFSANPSTEKLRLLITIACTYD